MDVVEPVVLRGQTVLLRPLSATAGVALAAAAAESRQPYRYTRVPDGVEEARSYIETALADQDVGRRMPFAILWHDRVVGSTSYLDLQRWRWPAGSPLQRTVPRPRHRDEDPIAVLDEGVRAPARRVQREGKHPGRRPQGHRERDRPAHRESRD